MMLFRMPTFLKKKPKGMHVNVTVDMDKLRPLLDDAISRSMSIGGKTFDTLTRLRDDPHYVAETMCWKCGHRWIATFPTNTLLKQLQCPHCEEQGFAFMTSQDLDATGYKE